MGACLSCLGSDGDDGDYNERTSLLGNHTLYSDENLQEELLKQQQRQNELNNIVNALTDNLIDVSTFMSNSNGSPGQDILYLNASLGNDEEATASPQVAPAGTEDEEAYPRLLTVDDKLQILSDVEKLDGEARRCDVVPANGPLYITF